MATVEQVVDYIRVRIEEGGVVMNLPKLQRLAYYTQAWALATRGQPLFSCIFQAGVFGPRCPQIQERFAGLDRFQALPLVSDEERGTASTLSDVDRLHINEVLEAYAALSCTQLDVMTRREDPWILARGAIEPSQACEIAIDEAVMARFYRWLLEETESEAGELAA